MCFERTFTKDEEAARSRRRLWERLSAEEEGRERPVQVAESEQAEQEAETVREKVPAGIGT